VRLEVLVGAQPGDVPAGGLGGLQDRLAGFRLDRVAVQYESDLLTHVAFSLSIRSQEPEARRKH
jgi:hypothetical protein